MKQHILQLLFIFITFYSCTNDDYTREDLTGTWQRKWCDGESGSGDEYFIFSGDSVKSYNMNCYRLNLGTYSLQSNELTLHFDGWKEVFQIRINSGSLELIELHNPNTRRCGYFISERNFDFDDSQFFFNPSCFEEFLWVYTGKKEVMSDFIRNDTTIIPPPYLDLRRSSIPSISWDKWYMRNIVPGKNVHLLIQKYNGYEIFCVPYIWTPEYIPLSDTAYIYKRLPIGK